MDELKELRQLLVEAAEDLAGDVYRAHIMVRLTLDQIGGLLARLDGASSEDLLSDKQIILVMHEIGSCRENDEADHISFARAILAAVAAK